jgi:hypothetical protein
MPQGSPLTAPLHGETTVVKVVFTRRRDSFAADEPHFPRLRLDHGLPGAVDGSFSPEVNASHAFVVSSRGGIGGGGRTTERNNVVSLYELYEVKHPLLETR